jgi:hypothetical protein
MRLSQSLLAVYYFSSVIWRSIDRLEFRLRRLGIAISVSKSNSVFFVKAVRRNQKHRPEHFLGEPIEWAETGHYLGVNLGKQPTGSAHVSQLGNKAAQRLGVLGFFPNRRSGQSVRNGVLLYRQLVSTNLNYASPVWRSGNCKCYSPSFLSLQITHIGMVVRRKFTRIWRLHFSTPTEEH